MTARFPSTPETSRNAPRPLRPIFEGSPELWGYRAAAAVLASFVPDQLLPLAEDSSPDRRNRLLDECEVVTFDSVPSRWSLKTLVRQTTLMQLTRDDLLPAALAANPGMDNSVTQRTLERCLRPSSAPFGLPQTLEEAAAMVEVSYWLEPLPLFWLQLPSRDSLRQFLAAGQLLDPFRSLVGDHFAGRRAELNALADYVGLQSASTFSESLVRKFESVFNLSERPPLFVLGPGGAGKSTLIAKFVLEHAEATGKTDFPFAYLDFDRTALLADEPVTLLLEIMNQLSVQYPTSDPAYRALLKEWTPRIRAADLEDDPPHPTASRPSTSLSGSARTSLEAFAHTPSTPAVDLPVPPSLASFRPRLLNRSFFLGEFTAFVQSLPTGQAEQPLLLVLDTFEEVQFRSRASEEDVFGFLNDLQQLLPRLRTVLCGRTEIMSTDHKVRTLNIGNFDPPAALAFLQMHGISDPVLAATIVKQVGGSPLVLRLAADVARREDAGPGGIEGLRSRWLDLFRSESVEVVLYKRILLHVYDERVKRLANPGLVLRFITPEVVLGVLGPACDLSIAGMFEAQDIVRVMKRQLATLLIPLGDREKLAHRPDMRAILLADLASRSQKDTALAAQLVQIHTRAVQFYADYDDDESRAEEIFHRLCLKQDRGDERSLLKARWRDTAGAQLGSAVLELTPEAQAFVAARTRFDVKQEVIDKAGEEDWLLLNARQIEDCLRAGKPHEAAARLRARTRRPDFQRALPPYQPLVEAVLSGYARFYEDLREQYPSGSDRTARMTRITEEVRALPASLQLDATYTHRAFARDRPGDRIVGLALAQSQTHAWENPHDLPLALDAIANARTPFEQYHGLLLANSFEQLSPQQQSSLRRALLRPTGIPFVAADSSRSALRDGLLNRWRNGSDEIAGDIPTEIENTSQDSRESDFQEESDVSLDDFEPHQPSNSKGKTMLPNPALNLEAFVVKSQNTAPPPLNALYTRNGTYDGMTRADVAKAFEVFAGQNQTDRLALFFHGGLVDKASGQQSAANEYDYYKDLVFPLFFIWESGFKEVLSGHLAEIFTETIFGRVLKHAQEALAAKLPGAGLANTESTLTEAFSVPLDVVLTQAEIDAFQASIESDSEVQQAAAEIATTTNTNPGVVAESFTPGKTVQLSPKTMMSPQVVLSVQKSYMFGSAHKGAEESVLVGGALQAAWAIAKAAVPILLNVVRRFAEGRAHGMPCTLVEEILRALYVANFGSSMWEEMKRETANAFLPDSAVYGGTAVVEEIVTLLQSRPQTVFSLVGHSTGGVYIGHFLQAVDSALKAQGDTTTQFDILLLAPANTVDFFAQTYTARVRGIRIFQMSDATEQQDHLLSRDVGPTDPSIFGKVYPRSLLYLVSGVCEYFEGQGGSGVHRFDGSDMPILGMDRFFASSPQFPASDYPSIAAFRNQFAVAAFPKFARVLSPTGPGAPVGFQSTSQKHGNFPGDPATIESLKFCFQYGV